MRQTIAGDKLTLYRYDGVDGEHKSKMAKIGSISLDTKPDAIPEGLVDDLTPKELRELKESLKKEQWTRAVQKIDVIASSLDDLLVCASVGILGPEKTADLEKTTAEFLKRLRKIDTNRKR